MLASLWMLGMLAEATPMDTADPWGRPTHARVVIEAPSSIEDLYASERRFRFWWDNTGATATIEMRSALRWKTIATEVSVGWISEELPRNAVFRIRLKDGKRSSNPLSAPHFYSPSDLAKLSILGAQEPNPLLSNVVLDLEGGKDLWVATYGGGLVQYTEQGTRIWTQWDGLPDDRVLSVSVDRSLEEDVTWVGTATGLAQIYQGQVQHIWQKELANPYVQSLDAAKGRVYVGTYKGLDVIEEHQVTHLLSPWSVFSILSDGNKVAVGYEGITFINEDGRITTQDWSGNIDALAQIGNSLWMATEHKGLVQSNRSGSTVVLAEPIQDILATPEKVYLAGTEKIWSVSPNDPSTLRPEIQDVRDPLALATYKDRIWIGGTNGLRSFTDNESSKVPDVPWTSNQKLVDLAIADSQILLSLDSALLPIALGNDRPLELVHPQPEPVLTQPAFHLYKEEIWIWSRHTLQQFVDNRFIATHQIPESILDVEDWLGNIWLASTRGLYKYEETAFQLKIEVPNLEGLSSDGHTLWFYTRDSVHHLTPAKSTAFEAPSTVTAIAPSGLSLCVGTENGLFRLWKGREGEKMWEDPLGIQDQNVEIVDVVGDNTGACWMAGEDGSIGKIALDGSSIWWHLPEPDPPKIHKLVLDHQQIWVLTEAGTWFLWGE